jgi:hypothetical protein
MSRNKTYYPQHALGDGAAFRPATITVGALIERLASLDPDLPVIFKSPDTGVFGSGAKYALDGADHVKLERQEIHEPASTWYDEERDIDVPQEAYTEVLPAWEGVVIS